MDIPFTPASIHTEADIKAFFVWLVEDQDLNFHCDTPFEDYINIKTRKRTYTDE